MNRFTISQRIVVGFAVLIAIVGLLGFFTFARLHSITAQSNLISGTCFPGINIVGQIEFLANENATVLLKDIMTKNEDLKAGFAGEMRTNIQKINVLVGEYGTTVGHIRQDSFQAFKAAVDSYAKNLVEVIRLSDTDKNQEAVELKKNQVDPFLARIHQEVAVNRDEGSAAGARISAVVQNAQWGVSGGFGLLFFLAIIVSVAISMNTGRALRRISNVLVGASNEVGNSGNQVANNSQSLAEGSGEQAAALEQTSSSLEEMSSMTKQNAENAQKANELAKQARAAADKGSADMQAMSAAMEAIKVSSDDIAKIIKTIDEIAFQTNILALNAAVEAARAGEAGMGFAVVADEVRNLAQRSAQAAKETAAKIEGAITRTSQGVGLTSKVGEALNDIVLKIRQVDELAAEVASASREQTHGIAQINNAVGQMDKVTQNNAANAQQSAAAAQELNAQAITMKQAVIDLLKLVGANKHSVSIQAQKTPQKSASRVPLHTNGNGNGHQASIKSSNGKRLSEIPLEGDFRDF